MRLVRIDQLSASGRATRTSPAGVLIATSLASADAARGLITEHRFLVETRALVPPHIAVFAEVRVADVVLPRTDTIPAFNRIARNVSTSCSTTRRAAPQWPWKATHVEPNLTTSDDRPDRIGTRQMPTADKPGGASERYAEPANSVRHAELVKSVVELGPQSTSDREIDRRHRGTAVFLNSSDRQALGERACSKRVRSRLFKPTYASAASTISRRSSLSLSSPLVSSAWLRASSSPFPTTRSPSHRFSSTAYACSTRCSS